MKLLFTCLVLLPFLSFAQNNYVIRESNSVTPSTNNLILGVSAGNMSMTGGNNLLIGNQSGSSLNNGVSNISIGSYSGFKLDNGYLNVMIGHQAGYSTTFGYENIYIGFQTGYQGFGSRRNTMVGNRSGYSNLGNSNTFIGSATGNQNTYGQFNTFLGAAAGTANITGGDNVFVGANSGLDNLEGSSNTFLGTHTGLYNTTGSWNTFIGYVAGMQNTRGSSNIFLGDNAGTKNRTGNRNILIGPYSGTAVVSSTDNVLIGSNSQALDNLNNASAIGANALVKSSNAIVLGDTVAGTKVGIGLTAPQFPLDVRGIINLRNNGTIKFSHLANPNLRSGYTDQFLTVDENGETTLARIKLRTATPSDWADKVFGPGYSLQPLSEVEKHINQHGHLPDVPSAKEVTEQGVDLVKMNALLLQKIEELTLHSIEQQKRIEQQEKQHRKEIDELKALMKTIKN